MTPDLLLAELARLVPAMQARAAALDAEEAFPEQDFQALRKLGALQAPLPMAQGGHGAGTEPGGMDLILRLLTLLGQGNLSVGRLFEAHVNAIKLIAAYGTPAQAARTAAEVRDGHLFGLWVTDPPEHALQLSDGVLHGSKGPCSGAGHVTRALVTASTPAGSQMAVAALDATVAIEPKRGALQGMRAGVNGVARFGGTPLPGDALIGGPGDYLREPLLSTGAWRTSAVTLGGLDALVLATRDQLARRGHQAAPLQQDRFGHMLIAQETARLWTAAAAQRAEASQAPAADQVAYVNLARIAVEAACLDAMRLAQRALGLAAFLRPNPMERLLRDLAVYLRQPAPDSVLTEAALHGFSA